MDRYLLLAGAMGYAVVSLIVENRSARENILPPPGGHRWNEAAF
ncbi:MAG: hypothetical protein V8T86_06420 [Victivallis sp.]